MSYRANSLVPLQNLSADCSRSQGFAFRTNRYAKWPPPFMVSGLSEVQDDCWCACDCQPILTRRARHISASTGKIRCIRLSVYPSSGTH
ncbi:Serine/threonine-protein kinase svkA [Fusarium oxysporum f. sp. albedinis]|nr:Serine/threonine-protein kinase svkA [Fusarium oxysporum f. sp. albedinis]